MLVLLRLIGYCQQKISNLEHYEVHLKCFTGLHNFKLPPCNFNDITTNYPRARELIV